MLYSYCIKGFISGCASWKQEIELIRLENPQQGIKCPTFILVCGLWTLLVWNYQSLHENQEFACCTLIHFVNLVKNQITVKVLFKMFLNKSLHNHWRTSPLELVVISYLLRCRLTAGLLPTQNWALHTKLSYSWALHCEDKFLRSSK